MYDEKSIMIPENKKNVPTAVDYTAELQALRRFWRGEEIGEDLSIEDLLKNIIDKAMPRLKVIKKLHERYKIEFVPILNERPVCDPMKIDNRINNDFFSEIVDEKAGYFSGNPMSFTFPEEAKLAAERFGEFKKRVRLDDINYETTKNCAIGGYDARLVYLRNDIVGFKDNEPVYQAVEAVKQIPAYETILLGEYGYDEPEFGVRYYTYNKLDGKKSHRVELYMPFKMYAFEGESLDDISPYDDEENTDVTEGEVTEVGVHTYPFSKCPLYGYENNAELLGDAERVLSAIDAYDRVMSDADSELEAYRSAYLAFFGVEPPSNDKDEKGDGFNAKDVGAFFFRNDNEVKQDAKFITKDQPVQAKEAHLERLEDNIYRFSKTPNLREKKTGMAVSGEALKQRMMPIENKTGSFERKFVSGNLRMLECLSDAYRLRNIEFNPYDVTQTFKRKMPENLEYEAKLIELYKDYLPMERIYAMLSFVDNPQDLADWFEENEVEKSVDMYKDAEEVQDNEGVVDDGQVVETNTVVVEQQKR